MRPVEREASLEFDSIGLFIVDDQEGAIPWRNILFISKALSSDVGVLGIRGSESTGARRRPSSPRGHSP